jgi:hypothetical protein
MKICPKNIRLERRLMKCVPGLGVVARDLELAEPEAAAALARRKLLQNLKIDVIKGPLGGFI